MERVISENGEIYGAEWEMQIYEFSATDTVYRIYKQTICVAICWAISLRTHVRVAMRQYERQMHEHGHFHFLAH